VTTAPDDFARRVRRAYEWGRFKRALLHAASALLLTAISAAIYQRAGWSATIGATLFVLVTGLIWYGRIGARAAYAGLKVGALAFAIPIVIFHWYLGDLCDLQTVLMVDTVTGLGAGLLLGLKSARLEARRTAFLLCAGGVATLCGTLGCLFFGPVGVASMAASVLLSTAPFAVHRRAPA
jgi:hypothetical protein